MKEHYKFLQDMQKLDSSLVEASAACAQAKEVLRTTACGHALTDSASTPTSTASQAWEEMIATVPSELGPAADSQVSMDALLKDAAQMLQPGGIGAGAFGHAMPSTPRTHSTAAPARTPAPVPHVQEPPSAALAALAKCSSAAPAQTGPPPSYSQLSPSLVSHDPYLSSPMTTAAPAPSPTFTSHVRPSATRRSSPHAGYGPHRRAPVKESSKAATSPSLERAGVSREGANRLADKLAAKRAAVGAELRIPHDAPAVFLDDDGDDPDLNEPGQASGVGSMSGTSSLSLGTLERRI